MRRLRNIEGHECRVWFWKKYVIMRFASSTNGAFYISGLRTVLLTTYLPRYMMESLLFSWIIPTKQEGFVDRL